MTAAAAVTFAPLSEKDLPRAQGLLQAALPHDQIALVAREKLFGANGTRQGRTLGAFCRGALAGVLAQAGRWIKLLAVDPERRRRGIGSALLEVARRDRPGPLRCCDHPGNYLSPGVDVRYEEGLAFLRARGFVARQQVHNLRAPLRANPLVTAERARELAASAASRGYAVRRARAADAPALLPMIAQRFSSVWAFEIERALGTGGAAGVHAAFGPSGEPVAFAAHDGNNRGLGWFGPMGTLPEHRGRGLGEALLLPCLLDVRDRPEGGVIAWVGPVEFYRRACGAVVDRTFVVYEESE